MNFSEENRPRISVSPIRHTVSIGGEVTFRCSVEGSEVTQVQWIRADGRSLPARAVVGADHALTFQKVESTDEGRYICIASNGFGKSQEEVSLTVSGKLQRITIDVEYKALYLNAGTKSGPEKPFVAKSFPV